ncbi:hypothetical protein ABW21_db0209821 [Orbilia brochopaga]|nr:hypothetical protein ABW21_db0209821 [Drechslerella brochopaga]
MHFSTAILATLAVFSTSVLTAPVTESETPNKLFAIKIKSENKHSHWYWHPAYLSHARTANPYYNIATPWKTPVLYDFDGSNYGKGALIYPYQGQAYFFGLNTQSHQLMQGLWLGGPNEGGFTIDRKTGVIGRKGWKENKWVVCRVTVENSQQAIDAVAWNSSAHDTAPAWKNCEKVTLFRDSPTAAELNDVTTPEISKSDGSQVSTPEISAN